MQLLARLVCILALLWVTADSALGTPVEDLAKARELVRAGQYQSASTILTGVLYPDPSLTDAEDLGEAHLLLGICYFELGQAPDADREIEEALALDPSLRISTRLYSQQAVEFFEAKRQQFEKRLTEEAAARERARLRLRLESSRAVEKRQLWLNFVPLGLGQWQNGDRKKFVFFFASEAAMAGVSFGVYAYLRLKYRDGRVPLDELGTANTLQGIHIVTGAAFYILYVLQVAEGIYSYEGEVIRSLTNEEIEELLQEEEPGTTSSFRLIPTITPDGAGAGAALSWEF